MQLLVFVTFLTVILVVNYVYSFLLGFKPKEMKNKWNDIIENPDVSEELIIQKKFKIPKKLILAIITGIIINIILKSVIPVFILIILHFGYEKYLTLREERLWKETILIQFRDFLNVISSSLKAGYSLPIAIEKSEDDLRRLHEVSRTQPMIKEIQIMKSQMNSGIEAVLENFNQRVPIEEVGLFVSSVLIVERKGGNVNEIVSNVSDIIVDKIEIKRNIETITSGKKFEANLLTILPVVISVVLYLSSPTYYDPLTDTIFGQILLLISLVLIIINYFVSRRIVDIKV